MLRELIRQLALILISVSVVTGSTALVLRLLKAVPYYIQPGAVTWYESVDRLESTLGLRVLMPSYFPDFLQWPAQEIQARQYEGLILSFTFMMRKEPGVGLQMYQILSVEGEFAVLEFREPLHPEAEKHIAVGPANGVLLSGTGEDGRRWMRLQWNTADRIIVLISACSETDLLRMARSIHE